MSKLKIGIYFTPCKEQGGVYQYSTSILEALYKIKGNNYVIFSTSKDVPDKFYRSKRFKIVDFNTTSREFALKARDVFSNSLAFLAPKLINLFFKARIFSLLGPFLKFTQRQYIKTFESYDLDLIFYPTSSNLSFLTNIPAVVTIHDLQHRINPHFKEVSAGGRWEYREYGYRQICNTAFRILVDFETGREDVIRFYNAQPERVTTLKYLPPAYLNKEISKTKTLRICKKLGLPKHFVFYPARFWPHKNHINLIKSLNYLKKKGKKVNLVLTGVEDADFSSYKDVFGLIKEYCLDKQVYYLGYVNFEELSAIYKKAYALVMPTYNSTSNIPPLEAWLTGTPVITSDIRGCKDQLGDAGLLVDPDNPQDIADKIWQIYTKPLLRNELIKKGERRLKEWTFEDFTAEIRKIIEDFEKQKV